MTPISYHRSKPNLGARDKFASRRRRFERGGLITLRENRYLLRVWSEPGLDEEPHWRATLRDVRNGKVATFGDSEELVKYLTSDLASREGVDDERG